MSKCATLTVEELPPDKGVITGTVTSKQTGDPVKNVKITANDYSTETLADGTFELTVTPNTYTVKAEHPKYLPQTKSVTARAGETVDASFELEMEPMKIPNWLPIAAGAGAIGVVGLVVVTRKR